MSRKDTISLLKRRVRTLAVQARRQPETAQMVYGYLEQVRRWARRNSASSLVVATREAKNYILEVAHA